MALTSASDMIAGRVGWRLIQAATNAAAANAAQIATGIDALTTMDAPGNDAAFHAIQSKANSSGWTACATKRAIPGIGPSSKARNSIGCARPITGAARRFDAGAI